MKHFPIIILLLLLFSSTTAWCRLLILPGISYSTDVGGIAVINVFYKDQHPGRIAFMGTYTTKGSQWYVFEAIRPWKGAEWEVYLSYFLEDWMRYDPFDDEYHNPVVVADVSGINCRLASDIPLDEKVKIGGLIGFKTYRFFDFSVEEETHPGAVEQLPLVRQAWTNLDETYVGIRITHDSRDNRYHTCRGIFSRFEYHLVHVSAGANPYVFRTIGDVRLAVPLWERSERKVFPRMVWAQMANAGYIFSDVPDPVKFRIGGGTDLRGFPWKRFEGRGMGLYRNEFRLTLVDEFLDPVTRLHSQIPTLPELKPTIEFAVFADIGTTWYERLYQDQVQVGYGCGFRGIMPADVVGRVDVAWSDDGHNWGLYFSLAQSF